MVPFRIRLLFLAVLGLGLIATHSVADNPERRQARYKLAESALHKGARVVASNLVDDLTPKKELLEQINALILRANPTGIAGALKGMGAVSAGLIVGTALKLAGALRVNVMGMGVCAALIVIVFVAVAVLRSRAQQAV